MIRFSDVVEELRSEDYEVFTLAVFRVLHLVPGSVVDTERSHEVLKALAALLIQDDKDLIEPVVWAMHHIQSNWPHSLDSQGRLELLKTLNPGQQDERVLVRNLFILSWHATEADQGVAKTFINHSNQRIVLACVHILMRTLKLQDMDYCLGYLAHEEDWFRRLVAFELTRFPVNEVLEAMEGMMSNRPLELRCKLIRSCLALPTDGPLVRFLLIGSRDASDEVRMTALNTMQYHEHQAIRFRLEELRQDLSIEISERAGEILQDYPNHAHTRVPEFSLQNPRRLLL